MATLDGITRKIFSKNGYIPKDKDLTEELIKETLRPFAMLDMCCEEFYNLDKSKFSYGDKLLYNKIKTAFIKTYQAFHNGMKEDELYLFSDYEDAISEQMSKYWNTIKFIISNQLAGVDRDSVDDVVRIILVETISMYVGVFIDRSMMLGEKDIMVRSNGAYGRFVQHAKRKRNDYDVMVENLRIIFLSADKLAASVRAKAMHLNVAPILDLDGVTDFRVAVNMLFKAYIEVPINLEEQNTPPSK